MVNLTKSTKPIREKEVKREWRLFDAKSRILGRFVSEIIKYLVGKNKIDYVPNIDMGDFIVVINAKYIVLTGRKEENKVYSRYSGYPGGLKKLPLSNLREKNPVEIIRRAVSGMLPKNKLRKRRLTRLFVFTDDKHPYKDKFKIQNPKFKN